jgi:hypothetical protein
MKKLKAFVLLVLLAAPVSFLHGRGLQLMLFGGINYHFPYGSVKDYILGENDFPVTPAHWPAIVGLSFGSYFKTFGIELEGRWTMPSSVLLEDPFDGDSVEVKTIQHLTLVLNIVIPFFRGAVRPYLLGGGGADIVFAKDATYQSNYGYEISIPAPTGKERIDPEAHAGGGIQVFFSKTLGIRLDVRYVWIFDKPKSVPSLQATGGLIVNF